MSNPSKIIGTCQICGKPIQAPPLAPVDEKFCCESCYLRSLSSHVSHKEQVKSDAALAEALASALDLREHETGLHSKRVACHTLELARHAFNDDRERLRQIYWGALLHDIGKIGIPDAILLKQGPLTDGEWQEMRTHPDKGYNIVCQIPGMQEAADIVLCHEEHFDGSGYPRGLSSEDIPLDRPYRKGLEFDAAKTEIQQMSGSQFDPYAVGLFLDAEEVLREMVSLKCGKASAQDILPV